jgi:hypothetical protein
MMDEKKETPFPFFLKKELGEIIGGIYEKLNL